MTSFQHRQRDESSAVNEVSSGGRGVTEAGGTDEALQAKSLEVVAATRAKDEFLALLGHELRNPLAPILSALHLMQLRGSDLFERERAIIERQVDHLVRLLDDLLDVSRITRGNVSLERAPLELCDVLAKALETASPLITQRAHHVSVQVASGLFVDADVARLVQVFSNLLTNAAKYTPPGGLISVRAHRERDQIVASIRDTGVGIRPEILPDVFGLFVQEAQPSDRSKGGLGLGLAIVRSLVTLHGGTVEARSAGQGRGSEFIVRLPAGETDPLSTPQKLAGVRPAGTEARTSKRILVVDDNTDAAECLAELLLELGHAVEVAHDGPAALTRLETFTPDIAFLDIGLPAMDGYELARRIREEERLAEVRLVAITGYGQADDKLRTAQAGFAHHLVKPVDATSIQRLVEA